MRAILHIDMDAFYASVEAQDHPQLRGKPLIVGGVNGRGVVAAASYEVRRYGVRSAMPMGEALRLCPHAVCVTPRMGRYQEVSARVFEIFHEFTPLVEGLSLDEAFLDVTASERLLGSPATMGTAIRARIHAQTGLTASVGVAPNKLLAKIASDLNKPDGMCQIDAGNLRQILDPLPITRLFGVGAKSLPRVLGAGIRTFGEARQASEAQLFRAFGRHGTSMRDRAAGLDERPVIPDRDEKSISAEDTFARDIRDGRQLHVELLRLTDRTASRLRAQNLTAGTVTVKIRRADFRTYTRQRSLGVMTQDTALIAQAADALLAEWRREQPDSAVRLLGVGVSQLDSPRQSELFGASGNEPSGRLDSTVDDIRQRFGKAVLTRASLLPRPPGGS